MIAALSDATDGPGPDRVLSPELERVAAMVSSGAVLAAVEDAVGALA